MKGDVQRCTIDIGAIFNYRTSSSFYLIIHFEEMFSIVLEFVN